MHDLPLITTIATAFTAAWLLGLLTQWLRLSPIVGYLVAGVILGPHTPGFVGDVHLAHQLAEVGVILLMFGVGLHFHLKDLLAVKAVALPGAIGQSLVATFLAVVVFGAFGMERMPAAVLGMALAVASTVVLMRVLMDADALSSPPGHVAVGWLLVEDVFTVIVLVLIPVLGGTTGAAAEDQPATTSVWGSMAIAMLKLAVMVGVVLVFGSRIVPWVMVKVARLRSRELFTLTVLVFSVAIAAGCYMVFGASMALGAFLAGMVVAQSPVSHQAAADALPLRDAFAVLFFVSVGMLFDPAILFGEPLMVLAALAIVLLAKPLAALLIVMLLGQPVRTALTVALGLAQIGEFSFILADLAHRHGLMSDTARSVLVATAIISITLSPLLYRSLPAFENMLRRSPRLWSLINGRCEQRLRVANASAADAAAGETDDALRAIVIGYGPVGRSVDTLLRESGLTTVVIELNMDTISGLRREGRAAIFGDARNATILEQAGIHHAAHLLVTLPHTTDRAAVVATARQMNPELRILVRARYLRERHDLEQAGASDVVFEEAEAALALARTVLTHCGADDATIRARLDRIRTDLSAAPG